MGCKSRPKINYTMLRPAESRVESYLAEIVRSTSRNRRYQIIRSLYALSRRLAPSIFLKAINRSLKHQLYDVSRLEIIAGYILNEENLGPFQIDVDPDHRSRESYLEGEITDVPNLEFFSRKYGGNDG